MMTHNENLMTYKQIIFYISFPMIRNSIIAFITIAISIPVSVSWYSSIPKMIAMNHIQPGERYMIPIRDRIHPPKIEKMQEEKRRALHVVQIHMNNIIHIQSRINNIIVLLENANIDPLWLSSLILDLDDQILILSNLEKDITSKMIDRKKIKNILDSQRKSLKILMNDLSSELKNILKSIKS